MIKNGSLSGKYSFTPLASIIMSNIHCDSDKIQEKNSTNQIDFNSMDQTNWNSLTSLTPTQYAVYSQYTLNLPWNNAFSARSTLYVDKKKNPFEWIANARPNTFVEMTVNSIDEMSSWDDEKREHETIIHTTIDSSSNTVKTYTTFLYRIFDNTSNQIESFLDVISTITPHLLRHHLSCLLWVDLFVSSVFFLLFRDVVCTQTEWMECLDSDE